MIGDGPRCSLFGRVRRLLLLAAFVQLAALAAHADSDGAAVVANAWARYRHARTEREEIEFLVITAPQAASFSRADAEAILRDGPPGIVHKRAVRHLLYAEDGHDKIHLLFSLPPDDADTGFLVWRNPGRADDDQWLFLPGLPNVRRISASSTQSFMGTDLIYEDIRELTGERTERFTYETLPAAQVGGRICDVIAAKPKPGTSSAYSHRKIWFDKEWLLPLQVEFYDQNGTLLKVMNNRGIHEAAPTTYRADLTEVRDVQLNETTLILVTKRAVGLEIPANVFTQDYLLHPRPD